MGILEATQSKTKALGASNVVRVYTVVRWDFFSIETLMNCLRVCMVTGVHALKIAFLKINKYVIINIL